MNLQIFIFIFIFLKKVALLPLTRKKEQLEILNATWILYRIYSVYSDGRQDDFHR